MKLVALLILVSLFSGCSTNKYEPKSEKEYEIISYFNIPDGGYEKFKEIAESAPTPDIKAFFQGSLKYYNKQEYGKSVVNLFKSEFSAEEIDYISGYITSTQGKQTQSLFKNISNPKLVNALFESLSSEQKMAVENFMASPAGKKFGGFLGSTKFRDINKSYGELLGCRYLSEHKKSEFEIVKSKGKCLKI